MKTVVDYYKLFLVSITIMVFLPLPTLWAYGWDAYHDAMFGRSTDLSEGEDILQKVVRFNHSDPWDGTSFELNLDLAVKACVDLGEWGEYNKRWDMEAYAFAAHGCLWEWNGPPGTSPGLTCYYDLEADGYADTGGDWYDFDAEGASVGMADSITDFIVIDSDGHEDAEANCSVSGFFATIPSIADSDWSHYDFPDSGGHYDYGFANDYPGESYSAGCMWHFWYADSYSVAEGNPYCVASTMGYCSAEAHVYLDADDGEWGNLDCYSYAWIESECSVSISSN